MKAIALLVALMLSIVSAAAITSVYESTSVSRIVGNTPDEMLRQFDRGDLNFNHASHYGSSQGVAGQNKQLLSNTFGTGLTFNPTNNWVESTDQKLMVFDSPYVNDKPDQNVITTNDIAAWSNELDGQHSLIVMNAQYAGLSLPRMNGFGTKTPPHAAFIAPTAYKSQLLLKTLLCNVGAVSGLGKTFRQARNNYHWNIGETLWGTNELVGLMLISYSLYGNPFARVSVPYFDTAYRTSYCRGLMEDFEAQSATQYSIAATGTAFTKTVTFTISDSTVETADAFELIKTPETDEQYIPGEPVLPARVVTSEFPLKTLITEVKTIGFSDPVEIDANVPMWDGTLYSERNCAQNTATPGIDFSHAYSENSEAVLARVNPIEIVDCEQGKFKLYKTTTYEITYYPYSPVSITSVEVEDDALPGTIQTVTVHLENTQNAPVTGQLALTDNTGSVVSIKNISTTQSTHTLELPVPENEGTYTYYAEFIQDGQSKTRYELSIDVQILEAELFISGEGSTAEITIIVHSNWQTPITSDIAVQLSNDGSQFDEKTQTATIQPGDNEFTFSFSGLTKEDQAYDVLAIIPYQGHDLTISSKIITNHVPAILNSPIVIKEGETILVELNVIDADGDVLVTEISEQPFALDGTHTFSYEESGEYSFTITSTDGISTVEMTIPIIVENVNRPPDVSVPETVQGKEGQELIVSATASDPDNENTVENDDNNLTITYGPPLDSNGKYTANFDEQRETITFVKVSDGKLETTKLITLEIENTNRAPHLDNLTNVTINEGDYVDLWKGRDPDNENNVANDDNTLWMYFGGGPDGGPIDHFGKWQTDFDDSGVYPITVQVEDGELKAGKAITVTVQNVNRPPVISAPDVVYASGSVDLAQYVSDPDNTNSVTTDDNILTITYTSPFDSNGKWTPAQPDSAAQVTITVSDEEFTITKTIMVMVDVVGVQPVQNPPVEIIQESTPVDETTTPEDTSPPTNPVPTPIPSATITGQDLAEYPYLFMANDVLDATLVFGDSAPTVHAVSAFDINGGLQQMTGQNASVSLDRDISSIGNIISVGGPCDNSVTQQISGKTDCHYNLQPGEGIIELFNVNGKVQIIVAGYDDIDVRRAARALANWGAYQLHGTSVIVKGTTLIDITVSESTPSTTPSVGSQPAAQQNIVTIGTTVQSGQETQQTTPIPQQQTQQTTQNEQPALETLEIKVFVDGKEVDDGDSVRVKPDDTFKVKVDLQNNVAEEKEVDVDIELDDFDQDDGDSVTLKPGENERFTFEFDVPRLTDDDEYPLMITINDEKLEITLKIDKPSHEITIRSFTVEPEIVPCEETFAKLKIRVENTGKDDEEGTITVESNTLKLLDEWPFDLPEGESHLFEKVVNALVPGEHDISVKALYGRKTAEANSKLTVESCKKEETQKMQTAPEERIALALSSKQAAAPITTDASAAETITIVFIVLTGIFAVLLLAVFIPPLFKN